MILFQKGNNMKKIIFSFSLIVLLIFVSGCFKRDDLEGVTIYTTIYPVKYLTQELYGYNSTVKSIYPKGVKIKEFKISDKKIKDFANDGSLFIYSGLSKENDIAVKFLKNNKKIRIIDVSQGLKLEYSEEELWLSPSNFLMLALNIKNGLKEYISNNYIHQEIENNYQKLKADISFLEAELKLIAENAKVKTIIVNDDVFNFLNKYGFEVISLDPTTNKVSEEKIAKAKRLIQEKKVQEVFKMDISEQSNVLKEVISNTKVEVIELDVITNLNEDQDETTTNYMTIMKENIEKLKKALYE